MPAKGLGQTLDPAENGSNQGLVGRQICEGTESGYAVMTAKCEAEMAVYESPPGLVGTVAVEIERVEDPHTTQTASDDDSNYDSGFEERLGSLVMESLSNLNRVVGACVGLQLELECQGGRRNAKPFLVG